MSITPHADNARYRLRVVRLVDGQEITTRTRVKRSRLGAAIQAAIIENAGVMLSLGATRIEEEQRASD